MLFETEGSLIKEATMEMFAFLDDAFGNRYARERPSKGTIAYQAVFMMGLPGAGKSFFKTKTYLRHSGFVDIDPDEIKKTHPDYDPEKPFAVHDWSNEVAAVLLKSTLEKGDPFVYDGTGASADKLVRMIREAREAGYRIYLTYVKVPLEISVWRNRNRKRFVPETIILKKAEEIDRVFASVKSLVNKVKIVAGYDSEEVRKAQQDIVLYPPPQKERPPRPGSPEYGQAIKKTAVLRVYRRLVAAGLLQRGH